MKFGLALASACGGVALLVSSQANATVYIGPTYPPPGGVTPTSNGVRADAGIRDVTYTNFDLTQTGSLYFDIENVQLTMDGFYGSPGETLTINNALSDLPNGIVVYSGTTTINDAGTNHTVYTLFTVTYEDLSNNRLALTQNAAIAGGAPVLNVTGSYQVLEAFTASSTGAAGSYVSAASYFNAAQTPPPPANDPNFHYLNSGFGGEFYYTLPASDVPEPASWAMMLLGFGGVGAAMRRSRKRHALLAQIA